MDLIDDGRCPGCDFDPREWNEQDSQRTLAQAAALVARWSEGASPAAGVEVVALGRDVVAGAADSTVDLHERVHQLWHGLVSIDGVRRAAGDVPPTAQGAVGQLSRSNGGVPKEAVHTVLVERRGLVGDRQATRVHHGRPWQALCLWSADVIGELAAEGHPIAAGAAGENVTIGGVIWSTLRAGTIVDIGEVRCRLTAPATPCAKNRRWFVDGAINEMDHDRHPGRSRWYASVLRPGTISAGDPVVVEPVDARSA